MSMPMTALGGGRGESWGGISPFNSLHHTNLRWNFYYLFCQSMVTQNSSSCVVSKCVGQFVSRKTIKTSAMGYEFCTTQITTKDVLTRSIVRENFIDVVGGSSSQR